MLLLILFPVLCGSAVWTRPFYESAFETPTKVIYVPQSTMYGNPDKSRYQLVAVPQFAGLSPNIQVVGDTLIAEGGYDPYGQRMYRRRYGVQPPQAVMRSHRAMVQTLGTQPRSQTDTTSNRINTGSPADNESSNMGASNIENEVNHEGAQTNMLTPAPDSMLTAAPDSMLTPSPDSQTGGDVETYQTRNETVPEQPPLDVELQRPHPEMTFQTRNETVPEQPPLDVGLQGPQMQKLKCSAF